LLLKTLIVLSGLSGDFVEYRRLGKTGYNASVITLGGCALGWLHDQELEKAQEIADKAIKNVIDHGINIIDVAPSYGEAEVRLKPWIKKFRQKIFLVEKTMERTKAGAWSEIKQSLERLGTSYFDLYQFHAVSSMEECNQIFNKNGAIEAVKEAQDTGIIKYVGITCHSDMRIIKKALKLYDGFSTLLLPVYIAAMVKPHPTNDFKHILKIAQENNLGIIAIKAISRRRWTFAKKYGTWYQPLEEQDEIDDAVWFTLSQEGVTTYSLPCDLRLWPLVLDAAKRYRNLDDTTQKHIIQQAKMQNYRPLFPD
jgi:aryl-alcohol dehydrogenase-like predicted oxidoreductase